MVRFSLILCTTVVTLTEVGEFKQLSLLLFLYVFHICLSFPTNLCNSCKADPRWYGARTSNPWENKRSAVRFRLLYVVNFLKYHDENIPLILICTSQSGSQFPLTRMNTQK